LTDAESLSSIFHSLTSSLFIHREVGFSGADPLLLAFMAFEPAMRR